MFVHLGLWVEFEGVVWNRVDHAQSELRGQHQCNHNDDELDEELDFVFQWDSEEFVYFFSCGNFSLIAN